MTHMPSFLITNQGGTPDTPAKMRWLLVKFTFYKYLL